MLSGKSAAAAKEQVARTADVVLPIMQIRFTTFPHYLGLVTQVYDCLLNDWFDAPARGRNGWFKTEATNDLLEHGVALRMSRELGDDFAPPALIEIGAVEPPPAALTFAG